MKRIYRITIDETFRVIHSGYDMGVDASKLNAIFGDCNWIDNSHQRDPTVPHSPGSKLKNGMAYIICYMAETDVIVAMMHDGLSNLRKLTGAEQVRWRWMMDKYGSDGVGIFPWEP